MIARRSQSPIPCPPSAPHLEVVELGLGWHRLRYSDPARPSRYAKPYGVVSMELLIAVAKKPARSPKDAHRMHLATRHVFNVTFPPEQGRKTATYFARWVTRRGKTGPWSRSLAMTIL